MQSYFTYQTLRIKKRRNYWKQPRFTIHWTLFTIHQTLCEMNDLFYHDHNLSLYLFISYIQWIRINVELQDMNKSLKQVGTCVHFMIIYIYITSFQHNIISNFFVMKYNLPTNWLFLLSLETQWKYVCFAIILLYVDLSTNFCMIPFSSCLFFLSIHCHCFA